MSDIAAIVEGLLYRLRWQLSLMLWWLWLKVTPNNDVKSDILSAVIALRAKYPPTACCAELEKRG